MSRPRPDYLPDDQDVLGVLRRRGCLSLRAVCEELWPDLRWRPLYDGEESMSAAGSAQGVPVTIDMDMDMDMDIGGCGGGGVGMTRALWVWQVLGRLIAAGRVQVAGQDPDEVDPLAAVSFELLGRRDGHVRARESALA